MEKRKLGPSTLLFPMPAVLIGADINGKPNFMTSAWCGIGAYKPPAVTVALRKNRYTLKGIRQTGTFSVNVSSCDMVKKVDYCGIYSGRNKDKSQLFNVFYGELKTAPLIQDCPVNLECKAVHYLDLESHNLVVGEIVETYMAESCLTDEKADPMKIDPLIYISSTTKYHRLGEVIASAFEIGKQ